MAFSRHMDIAEQLRGPDIEGPVRHLYDQYFESVIAQICQNGGTREDGADIFQEAVLVLIEKVKSGQFRGDSSLKTFLSAIARNLWLHELRTRFRRNKRENVYMTGEDKSDEIKELYADSQASDQLLKMLDQVGNPCKQILTGFYFEEKSMKELLSEFNYENEQVLRNRKSRCMKKLKELIKANPGLLNTLKSHTVYE
jgi:RNA polymerase sigma factor (sigma-70 family)